MIGWMQKHKKWLVITIWISTIAFVGAGFVGWGSYEYGKQGGVVAVVGDREVSVEEYQQEYSSLYSQYQRLFGSNFNKQMAEQLNLKDVAYKQVLEKNLILSYGDSLGLSVTNEDVAKELVKYDAFLKNGKFDKDTYIKVLNQNQTTPSKFESSIKRDILLKKVQKLFEVSANETEVKNLNQLLFLKDDISMKVLSLSDVTVSPKQEDIKKYWEENKNSYMSDVKYIVKTKKLELKPSNPSQQEIEEHYNMFKLDYRKDDGKVKTLQEAREDIIKELDKKVTKKDALKAYIKVKKGDIKLENENIYTAENLPFSAENKEIITSAEIGSVNKPFFENDSFVITNVVQKVDSRPLAFEDAKQMAREDYLFQERKNRLEEKAIEDLSTFNGVNVKGITRESIDKITLLKPQEAAKFLDELFSSTSKEGYINLGDKLVLYRINDSKLASYDESRNESVKSTLKQLKQQELMTNLIENLENTYDIQSSIEAKEK
ncbi:MAG: peptidylprolyl isomerase [Campylobacterota bacterium]